MNTSTALQTAAASATRSADLKHRLHWRLAADRERHPRELSRSALADQADRLGDLRTRAGTLLAAAAIAGSFSGVTHRTLDTIAVLALLAYVLCVAASIYVLMPHELAMEFRGTVLLDASREVGATDDEVFEAAVHLARAGPG